LRGGRMKCLWPTMSEVIPISRYSITKRLKP
jgi:hypothetical protein